jgi:hypothetical protein
MLTKEQIEKFKAIYRKNFNKEISDEDAYEQGIKLVCLFKQIYRPMTKEEYEKTQKLMYGLKNDETQT